jgi:VanZ family protein
MYRLTTSITRVNASMRVLNNPILRHVLALAWTLLATVLLVQSSSQPVVGPAAPPGAPDLIREIQLTFGHIVAFSTLVFLWWWAARVYLPSKRALFAAVVFAAMFSLITEAAQTFSANRSPSLYDLIVNWLVIIVTAIWIPTDSAI